MCRTRSHSSSGTPRCRRCIGYMDGNRVGHPWHTRANDQLLLHQLTRTFRIPPEHRRDFFLSPHSAPHHIPQSLRIAPFLALQATSFTLQLYPTFGDYSSILDASSRVIDHIPIRLRCSEFRIPPLESFLTLPQPDTPHLCTSQTSPTSRFPSRISSMLCFPSLIRFLKQKRGRPRRIKR